MDIGVEVVTSNLSCETDDCLAKAAALATMSYPHLSDRESAIQNTLEKALQNITVTNLTTVGFSTVSNASSNTLSIVGDGLPDVSFPTYMKGVYTAWGLLLLLVGLVGNLLVPLVVMKDRELRVATTSVFIVNLVVADLLVLIICLPTFLSELYAPPAVWILPESMCKFVPYVEFTVAHASLLTIMAISVERYRVICHPLTAAANCSRARAVCACVFVWLIATVVTSPIIILTEYSRIRYIDDSFVPVCYTAIDKLWAKVFVVSATMLLFFLPLLVLIVLYWRISRQLLLEDKQLCKDKPNPNLQARKQVVVMLGTVVVVFFVCLMPYRVFCLWIILTTIETEKSLGQETYYNLLYAFRILVYANSAINPLLYNVTSSKFRGAFMRLLGLRPDEQLASSAVHRTTSHTLSNSIGRPNPVSWRRSQRLLVRCSYTCLQGEGEMKPLVERMPPESPWAHTNGAHHRSPSSSPARSPFLERPTCPADEPKETESFV